MSDSADNRPIALREESRLLTFLIADIRGYSKFSHEHGDAAAARLASSFASAAREVISEEGGAVIELRGDEAVAVFTSARQAAHAATELQLRCTALVERDPSLPMTIGVGLDAGDVVPFEDGYRGRALNVAARLCSLAGPGQILVGEGLVHLAGTVDGLDFVSRGSVALKGVGNVGVYQVGRTGDLPQRLPRLPGSGGNDEVALGAMVIAATAGGLAVVAIIVELLVSSLSGGLVLQLILAGLATIIGFSGLQPARKGDSSATGCFVIAAIGLVLTLRLFGALPALLYLVAAGLNYFSRQFGGAR